VALLPSAAYQLIKRGHQVLVGRHAASAPVTRMPITSRRARRSSRITGAILRKRT